MDLIEKLRARQKECLDRMEEINQLTITEQRDMTEKEQEEFDSLEAEDKEIEDKVEDTVKKQERAAELAARREELNKPVRKIPIPSGRAEVNEPNEFRAFGEFLYAVRFRPNDSRLQNHRDLMTPDERRGYDLVFPGSPGKSVSSLWVLV